MSFFARTLTTTLIINSPHWAMDYLTTVIHSWVRCLSCFHCLWVIAFMLCESTELHICAYTVGCNIPLYRCVWWSCNLQLYLRNIKINQLIRILWDKFFSINIIQTLGQYSLSNCKWIRCLVVCEVLMWY